MMLDFAQIGLLAAITAFIYDAQIMYDAAWVTLTITAIAVILYVEIKRAYRRAKQERDRQDLRRHVLGDDADE